METVHTTEIDTPVGRVRLASTERGLAYLELPHASGRGFAGWQRRHAPQAAIQEAYAPNRAAAAQVLAYLSGKRSAFDLPLDLRATEFQHAVYRELREIPYGETRSYGDVARRIGSPRALRAVGAASGANPLPLVIPCHRVIAADGRLGGYGGGAALKRRLLAMERSLPASGRFI